MNHEDLHSWVSLLGLDVGTHPTFCCQNIVKSICFQSPRSSNCLFRQTNSLNPKYIQFTKIQNCKRQEILTFDKLKPIFFLVNFSI